jgi:DNA-binding NarL/FixJ family response regulator
MPIMSCSGNVPTITRREHEVIEALVEGATAREVAEALGLSFHTVRTHIRNIYEKTGAANRIELLKWQYAWRGDPEALPHLTPHTSRKLS